MKKSIVIVLVLLLCLAAVGIGYGKWTDSISVDGAVSTAETWPDSSCAQPALAAASSFEISADPPEPTYDNATVDGFISEWNLSSDNFANMYEAGKPEKAILSTLYLRYDCDSQTLYALVLAADGFTVQLDPDGAFIKLGWRHKPVKLVDGNYGNDGTPPDFAWVYDGDNLIGWEASAPLAQGIYNNLNVHTQIAAGRTSAVENREIDLSITCGQTGLRCTIGDAVWLDSNGNGIQDAVENGIANVTVQLWDCEGNFIRDTATDSEGFYQFTGLETGCYVVVIPAANFLAGGALHGLEQTYDYDGLRDNRTGVNLTEPGQVFLDADFAYRPPSPPVPGVAPWSAIGAAAVTLLLAIYVLNRRALASGI